MLVKAMSTPVLFYRGTCRRCQLLSCLAFVVSLGVIRCVRLDSDEAQALYEQYPQTRGKLALIHDDRVYCGARTVGSALLLAVAAILSQAKALFLQSHGP